MKGLVRLKLVLLFIFGFRRSSLPLSLRLLVVWRELKTKIHFPRNSEKLFSLTYPNDEAFLSCLINFETLAEFIAHIRSRTKPEFFLQPESKTRIIAAWEELFPKAKNEVLQDADRIVDHIFDLLGSGATRVSLPTKLKNDYQPIDWQVDFKSGYRWDTKTHFKEIKYGDIPGVDVKVPWELSRCQHLPTLGKAYWVSGNEKYAREFVNEIDDWMESNPPLYGVNWACPMDVAIRVVNWIWGFYFCKDSPETNDEFLLKFLKSLYLHGKFIEGNLEINPWGMNSNHFLSDLTGLIYLGMMFPEFKEAKKWRDFAIKALIKEMGRQVYPEGVDYEGSLSYHRLVTELFLSATLLCVKNGITFPNWYLKRLENMIEFVTHYTKPDGVAPQIGDGDDGRLYILANYGNWNRLDHRYLLTIGAILFHNPHLKSAAGQFQEEAFWLLGEAKLEKFKQLAEAKFVIPSKAFPQGGFYIMRKNDLHMIIDCVPLNNRSPSGHKHNSRLSFELFAYDHSFIIDPGAYIYTADKDMRNLFRSTIYHNTVTVDGEEQSRFAQNELFNMGQEVIVKVNRWDVTEVYDFLDAEHHGYTRLKQPVVHQRQIFFNKVKGYWLIKDILRGQGNHQFALSFHLTPLEVETDDRFPLAVKIKTAGAKLAIIPLETDGISLEVLDGLVSYRYGEKLEAPIIRYSKKSQAPTSFSNILYPYSGEINVKEVRQEVGMDKVELFERSER